MYITERFSEFIVDTRYEVLPEEVIRLAKERILDTVGAAVAGKTNWEQTDAFLEACQAMGTGSAGVWGESESAFSWDRAAMIHATFAHAIELDDGHKNAGCHAGAVIVPVALTLGEMFHASGKDIITAVVIGYEVVYRVVAQMMPHQIKKGFHPSGNCDTFGAMAVTAKLMGLTKEQIASGLGFAGLFSAGLMEATVSGQQSKCIQVGQAALNGVAAAWYARAGLAGTVSVLEGKTGFFRAQAEPVDFEQVCEGLGERYLIGDTYSKLYPTCRHSQPAIEGVLDLVEEYGFGFEEVKSVWVGTHQVAIDLTGQVKHPETPSQAKFSIAYGVALALREHSVGVCHLNQKYIQDSQLRQLADLVTAEVDQDIQALYPTRRGSRIRVVLKDGKVLEKELFDLKGSPDNPVGWRELEKKFVDNLTGVYPAEQIRQMSKELFELEQVADICQLTDILHKSTFRKE